MTTTAHRPGSAAPAAALDRASAALDARRAADVALLVAAVDWAEANPAGPGLGVSGWGDADLFGEGFLPLAGEGAPSVAEFAPVELGAALGWSSTAACPLSRGGPPGQTEPLNLAPLCRRHHRAKTHGGWRYRRRDDGSYSWRSPTGRTYDVLPARHPRPPQQP